MKLEDMKKKVEGKIEEAAGKLTDDKKTQLQGKAKQVEADVKAKIHDAQKERKKDAEKQSK